MNNPERVYTYWFGEGSLDDPSYLRERMKFWFGKHPEVDTAIRQEFSAWMDDPAVDTWVQSPRGLVSAVILLDQFPRNAFRGSPRMFAYDARALAFTRAAVTKGMDERLGVFEAMFLYLPLEHSEDLEDQETSVRLYHKLKQRTAEALHTFSDEIIDYAVRHRDIIARFGRFPHRNEILGRPSTPDELEFLNQPGSRF